MRAHLEAAVERARDGDAARALRALRAHRRDERVELLAPVLQLLHEALERLRSTNTTPLCAIFSYKYEVYGQCQRTGSTLESKEQTEGPLEESRTHEWSSGLEP